MPQKNWEMESEKFSGFFSCYFYSVTVFLFLAFQHFTETGNSIQNFNIFTDLPASRTFEIINCYSGTGVSEFSILQKYFPVFLSAVYLRVVSLRDARINK